jgi:hypothetical protein
VICARPISQKAAKKQKKAKLSTLIDKADKLASQYIRQKYADHEGYVKCVSCDTILHWKDAHCAHFIERGKKATRWLEENLNTADASCNTFRKEYHMRGYTLFMMDTYGREFVDELRELEKKTLSQSDVRKLAEEAIEYYGEKLKSFGK